MKMYYDPKIDVVRFDVVDRTNDDGLDFATTGNGHEFDINFGQGSDVVTLDFDDTIRW